MRVRQPVSVIVPAYNAEPTLAQSLDAMRLAMQSDNEFYASVAYASVIL